MSRNLPKDVTEDAGKPHRASRIEDSFQAIRARSARRRGHREHVIPFTGYGSDSWVRILCRVVLLRAKTTKSGRLKKVRGWRSFLGIPVAGAWVTVTVEGQVFDIQADRGGVIDSVLPAHLAPGWHTVQISTGESNAVTSRVFVVSPAATLGVVCDIDDTVMVTALPRPFLAAWNSFVRDEHARRAVPGMSVLLDRFLRENPSSPVVYLSTGAWNVAPTLTRFLGRNLFPHGPLLLTDWGPTPDRWFRSGQEHKRINLERLVSEFPSMSWVLIGDDGQHDEEIYAQFASRHPDNVRAIAIRELTPPEALFSGGRHHIDRTRNPLRIPWVSAPNGAGLATELQTLGVMQKA
jgi:phosphatidate phosphatase APP1